MPNKTLRKKKEDDVYRDLAVGHYRLADSFISYTRICTHVRIPAYTEYVYIYIYIYNYIHIYIFIYIYIYSVTNKYV